MEFSKNQVIEEIVFDEIEFEAEFVEERPAKKFLTISGKESSYNPSFEKYGIQDMDVGDTFEGRPELTIFENEDKSYDALRIRIIDDGEMVDLYVNFPKKDYPYVKGINKSFDFYRKCFDFIYGVFRYQNEGNVVNPDGEEVNRFTIVNFEKLAKYVDQHTRIGVRITEGNLDSEYDSFLIYKLE